ncbi:MAG: 3-deoxy-7-phosphoheptulonate synthase [Oscillospiraceae bacterium]
MIVILNAKAKKADVERLTAELHGMGFRTNFSEGENTAIIGLIGDTSKIDTDLLLGLPFVETVKRISEPYKTVNRKMHPDNTVVKITDTISVGAQGIAVIAGPCSVETEEQIVEVALDVKKSGATMLRGGAFKPRTSPYAFQGLEGEGIRLLMLAKKATGLPIVTEIMNVNHVDLFADVDVIQVGARNMQNFDLLKELGRSDKPILLKRGLANTIEEWLMSAEYIMAGGNTNVILCERGIRTFETSMRNTLDISAVPMLKKLTHLPVVIDPSHAAGLSWMVEPLSKAAIAVGADGLMIEVHNNPAKALSDGPQSLNPAQFDVLMKDILRRAEFEGRPVI